MIYAISERYITELDNSYFDKKQNEINSYIDSFVETAVTSTKTKFNLGEFIKNIFKKISDALKRFSEWLFKDYIEVFKAAKECAFI